MGRAFAFQDSRRAAVTRSANFRIQFHASQKRYVELFGRLLCSATREDINFVLAMRADEVAHVLDHADDIHFHLAKHLDRFAGVLQGYVGWRRDHNRTGQRNGLNQGERYVTCTGREIDDRYSSGPTLPIQTADDRMEHWAAR